MRKQTFDSTLMRSFLLSFIRVLCFQVVVVKYKGENMGFQDRGFGGGPKEMHKAVCAGCKKDCEVPFKPSGDRPVYCKECFSKRKNEGGR